MKKLAIASALLAAALSLFTVAPAQAEVSSPAAQPPDVSAAGVVAQICVPQGCGVGYVVFDPVGDNVWACDAYADGYGVRASVWNQTKDPDAHEYYLTDANGADNGCAHASAAEGQPENLAETHCFSFGTYLVNNGSQVGPRNSPQLRNYNNDGPVPCPGVD